MTQVTQNGSPYDDDAKHLAIVPSTPPDDPNNGPQTGPLKTGFAGWLSNTFGLTPKDQQDMRAIAKRERRRDLDRSRDSITIDSMPVEELAITAGMSVSDLVKFLSSTNKEDDAVIDSFNDENEHPIGTAMHHIWTAIFYLAPPVIAMVVGYAVGQNFGGSFATIALCLLFEAIPIVLMLATAKQLNRALSGTRSAWIGAGIIGLFFAFIAIGSSIAQWTLFEGKINPQDVAQVAGAIIRTFTLPLAEIVSAVALPLLRKKSLDSHLNILDKRNEAKIKTNQKKIQNQIALINAAITTKASLQKEEDYQKKQDLANKIIDIATGKIIRDAEKSMSDDQSQDTGNSYRRDGRR